MATKNPKSGENDAPANVRLARLREWRGWTQEQLATASGFSLSTIKQYESGDTGVGFLQARRLSAALGIDLSLLWDVLAPDLPARDLHAPPKSRRRRRNRKGSRGARSGQK